MPASSHLNQVFARRWAVPILAQLANIKGCKFVQLTNSLDGSRASLKSSLELLDTLGLVIPNPGHGHPMRPEYILTTRGEAISKPAFSLVHALEKMNAVDIGLKKWSMPTVHAIAIGSDRFKAITDTLGAATDRAVSLALTDLNTQRLIQCTLVPGRPPRNSYSLTRISTKVAPILQDMQWAMTGS
tara:strand:- start:144202 stop:144759 length:558 start_codon:yes stop_codon:yes gene_type:complete